MTGMQNGKSQHEQKLTFRKLEREELGKLRNIDRRLIRGPTGEPHFRKRTVRSPGIMEGGSKVRSMTQRKPQHHYPDDDAG